MNAAFLCQSWRRWVLIVIAVICKTLGLMEREFLPAL